MSGALLRSALELAWAVAREEPEAAPRALRRIVRFATLPPAALNRVRRVVEEDEPFRARVAEAAALSEGVLGRASWLWLVRPEGWEEELALLDEAAQQAVASTLEGHEERSARRRLAAAEDAKQRAEAIAAAAEAAANRATQELSDEQAARRAAEARFAAAESELGQLRGRLQAAESAAAAVDVALADAQAGEAALREDRDQLAALAASLEADLQAVRGRLARADASAAEGQDALARAVADAAGAARALGSALSAASAALGGEVAPSHGEARDPGEGLNLAGGRAGVAVGGGLVSRGGGGGGVAGGVGVAGGGVGVAGGGVGVAGGQGWPSDGPSSGMAGGGAGVAGGQGWPSDGPSSGMAGRWERSRPSRPRRRPTPLPPAVFEDSAAAAEHLVRVSGMVLLVDGYNVSIKAWPNIPIPEQRRRLIDALAELTARTGVAARVIFDGAEQAAPVASASAPRSPVRVIFSRPGVEADEVLIATVDQLPLHQPVVVATSDRRVQDEVRRRGANVITTPELLRLLGRAG